MDKHTLNVLEFDKILDMLKKCAVSKPAKKLAGRIRPLSESSKVKQKLQETSDAVEYMVWKGKPPLSGIHNMYDIVKKARKGVILTPSELLKVSDVLYECRRLFKYFNDKVEDFCDNSIYLLYKNIKQNEELEKEIKRIIINEYEIADDASPELYRIRRKIARTKETLKSKLDQMIKSSKYQKYMQDSLVTVRNDRYVLPVKSANKSEVKGIVHDTSASGSTVFIEPSFSVDANNKIRELGILEKKEIEKILSELTSETVNFSKELLDNVYYATGIDFAFAKADLSFNLDALSPKISQNNYIKIVDGRHPLLDKETVVPLNIHVGDDFNTLMITGPNTGGKTVALKTCGLFCLMAQAGLHVPARSGTKLPVFKNIFCDIGDEQSIEQSLSTFSSHMTNIINIVKRASSKSLVLLDELGAGTDPEEGTALAMSILDGLHEKKCTVLATTHYSDLKLYALTNESMENACCEFDIESLKPTYKILMGIPGKSNALAISDRLGLPENYINNAKEYLSTDDIKFEEILQNIHKNKEETDKERDQAQKHTREIENLKLELEEERKKIEIEKRKIVKKAKDDAKRIISSAKKETDSIVEEMRKIHKENNYGKKLNEVNDLKRKMNTVDEKVITEDEDDKIDIQPENNMPDRELLPGDTVKILKLNQKGTLVSAPDGDGKILVQAGIMKVTLNKEDVVPVDEQKKQTKKIKNVVTGVKRPENIKSEIDVRGNTLNEALEAVEKYLDNVILAGLHEVSIIHGKGTGVLRKGIQQYLKNNNRIESYRNGKHGEGDFGVTVVTI